MMNRYLQSKRYGSRQVITPVEGGDKKLSTLPYYPYMKIEIMTLR